MQARRILITNSLPDLNVTLDNTVLPRRKRIPIDNATLSEVESLALNHYQRIRNLPIATVRSRSEIFYPEGTYAKRTVMMFSTPNKSSLLRANTPDVDFSTTASTGCLYSGMNMYLTLDLGDLDVSDLGLYQNLYSFDSSPSTLVYHSTFLQSLNPREGARLADTLALCARPMALEELGFVVNDAELHLLGMQRSLALTQLLELVGIQSNPLVYKIGTIVGSEHSIISKDDRALIFNTRATISLSFFPTTNPLLTDHSHDLISLSYNKQFFGDQTLNETLFPTKFKSSSIESGEDPNWA
jgi:hypothetical protein